MQLCDHALHKIEGDRVIPVVCLKFLSFKHGQAAQEDYVAWPGARPADRANSGATSIPVRPLDGDTDYTINFTNKHPGHPAVVHPKHKVTPSGPLYGCTNYGHEFIAKPIPARYNACVDRPWMNCDTCVPTELPSPDGGSGLAEKTWTKPPFATGKAVLQHRTEHLDQFKNFSGGACAPTDPPAQRQENH
jgi:hypothetical protein